MTADVYAHAIRGQDDEAVRKLEEFQEESRNGKRKIARDDSSRKHPQFQLKLSLTTGTPLDSNGPAKAEALPLTCTVVWVFTAAAQIMSRDFLFFFFSASILWILRGRS